MNQRSLAALVTLNVILLAGLALTVFMPRQAQAQFGGGNSYLMVSGEITGREQQAGVYIIDRNSAQAIVMLFRSQDKKVEYIGFRDIRQDMQATSQQRR